MGFFTEAGNVEYFSEDDLINDFAVWFAAVSPSKIFEIEDNDAEQIKAAMAELIDVPVNLIWVEYSHGRTYVANAEAWDLTDATGLSLPEDAYCRRIYVTQDPAEGLAGDFLTNGIISAGWFACEECEQTADEPETEEQENCSLCDHTGPLSFTIYDSGYRDELEAAFADFDIEIPDWLPEN